MRSSILLIGLAAIVGCSGRITRLVDAGGPSDNQGLDSGSVIPDAGRDGGPDAGIDAGTVGFESSLELTSDINTWNLRTADFNQDGIDDLVQVGWASGGPNAGVVLFYGLTDGGLAFGLQLNRNDPIYAAAGDLDGDGWTDLVVTTSADSDIDVEMNVFGSFARFTVSTPSLILDQTLIADFDQDGRPDLVSCAYQGVYLLLDDGRAAHFGPAVQVDAQQCQNMAVGDLNGDGLPDIVSVDGSSVLRVFLNEADGGFTSQSYPSTSYLSNCSSNPDAEPQVADINGDGLPDVICGGIGVGVVVYLNSGAGALAPPTTSARLQWPLEDMLQVVVADFNGDGFPDVGTAGGPDCDSDGGGGAFVFFNDGGGGLATGTRLPTAPHVISGLATWHPAPGSPPSLVVGSLCDSSLSIFSRALADAGF